jgi:hypothetical protein
MTHTWPGAGCIQATSWLQPVAWMQTAPPPMANVMPIMRLESGSSAGDGGCDSDGCGGGGGGSPHNLSTMPPGFRPLSRYHGAYVTRCGLHPGYPPEPHPLLGW